MRGAVAFAHCIHICDGIRCSAEAEAAGAGSHDGGFIVASHDAKDDKVGESTDQGDNVLVARINLLMTFVDYYKETFKAAPEIQTLKKIANIIAWNIWQMDGLKGTVPLGKPQEEVQQLSWFGDISNSIFDGETPLFEQTISADEGIECMIYDWRADRSIKYSELKKGRK